MNIDPLKKIINYNKSNKFKRAIKAGIMLQISNPELHTIVLLQIMYSYYRLADYDKLMKLFSENNFLDFEKLTNQEKCEVSFWQAKTYQQKYLFQKALDAISIPLSDYKFLPLDSLIKNAIAKISILCEFKNKEHFLQATKEIEQILNFLKSKNTNKNQQSLAELYGEIGRYYLNNSNPNYNIKKAEEYLLLDLKISKEIQDFEGIGIMNNQLAYIANINNLPDNAIKYLNYNFKHKNIWDGAKNRLYAYTEFARAYKKLNKPQQALEYLSKLINDDIVNKQKDDTLFYNIACIYLELEKYDLAEEYIIKTIKVIEDARRLLKKISDMRKYKNSCYMYYSKLSEIYLLQKKAKEIAFTDEIASARNNIDLYFLLNQKHDINFKDIDSFKEYLESKSNLIQQADNIIIKNKYFDLSNLVLNNIETKLRKYLKDSKVKLPKIHNGIVEKAFKTIGNKYPNKAIIILRNNHATIITKANNILITFNDISNENRNGYSTKKLKEIGSSVSQKIVENLPNNIKGLIIIPGESWYHIPIHASIVNNKHLIEYYTIQYHISAVLMSMQIEENNFKNKTIKSAIFYDSKDKNAKFKEEAELINSIISESKIYTKENMTSNIILKNANNSKIVHICAHNSHLDKLNTKSFLSLENDILSAIEILIGPKINAHLTLAACSSGKINSDFQQEPIGHISSLFCKSAKSILATSLNIKGEDSLEFMNVFYNKFSIKDTSESYRKACVELIEKGCSAKVWGQFFLYSC